MLTRATTEPAVAHRCRALGLWGTVAMAAVALTVGVLVGLMWHHAVDEPTPPEPGGGSVDAGFAQDMSVHHAQAVDMSAAALTLSSDPVVRTLAFDVLMTQQSQIGIMRAWLTGWKLPSQSTGGYIEWMSTTPMTHGATDTMPGAGTATMPGMASTGELQRLRTLTGTEFDGYYLQLLLRHHKGGLAMAQYAVANAEREDVRELAGRIVVTQSAESQAIRDQLAARVLPELPLP